MNKIEHEGIGNFARIEINQDADNADQKVKWFQVFIQVHILQIFRFSPP